MTRAVQTEQWAERIRAQRASGKSMVAFCREHGFNEKTFWRRARKFDASRVATTAVLEPGPSRFTRVDFSRPSEAVAVSVRFPAGVVIESSGGYPDPSWVRAVISGLVADGF